MKELGFECRVKPWTILTEEQIEDIHRSTLQVLWETGVRIESDWALGFLETHGCQVDREHARVRFPPELVEDCLAKVPSTFQVEARDPEQCPDFWRE